jgi:hypothetical protein
VKSGAAGALLIIALAVGSCEIVAGIKDRSLASGGSGGAGGPSGMGGGGTSGGSAGGRGGGPAGSSGASPALGHIGDTCGSAAAVACDGTNSMQLLICNGQIWSGNGMCATSQRCDSRPGAGTCAPIVPACVGKTPGEAVCVGDEVHGCGPDLVTTQQVTACAHPTPTCRNAACVCTGMTCGEVCADLTSDRNHCGRCDHRCNGECVASRCRLIVASDPITTPSLRGIAVDATNIYWTNPDNGNVKRAPVGGGTAVMVAVGQDAGGGAIAVDGTRVYWLTQNGVWSAPKTGQDQTATRLHASLGGRGITVDPTSIYFTSCCTQTRVMRLGLDGSAPTELATTGVYVGGVAVSGSSVFWTDAGTMWRTVIGSGIKNMAIMSAVGGANPSGLIAIDAASVYWVVRNGMNQTVMKSDLELGSASELATASGVLNSGSSIVLDGESVYWTGAGVMRAGLAGENPTNLRPDLTLAGGIAVDATSVYVTTNSGEIIKVEK